MAETRSFTVGEREKGRRLDKFLAENNSAISRSVIAAFIAEGRVRVDGAAALKSCRLLAGQEVTLELPEAADATSEIKPEEMPLALLYEDEEIVVIDKPSGICVHPAPGHWQGTLVNGLLARYPHMLHVGSTRRPGVVHRLDLDTSGAVVFALTPFAYLRLVKLIKARTIRREYLAVVHGLPAADAATVTAPVGRDPEHRRRFTVISPLAGGRPAVTHYEVTERFAATALLKLRLETGRTHQIRVHMKSLGHPLVGDATYAPERQDLGMPRQALHAARLEFPHPRTGKPVVCESPLPEDFQALLERLRRR